ncbi:hypothetical protein [Streptomyces sp. UNOB3_S3]|uniref:hypothetical protein n=1 Tax=Streptomyces sp. UNOB3_S3 TaxID=2871682 RepID=UPI001E5D325A|nr:hypothetical protein [Streptomyces sp. UNOB3_S3]MCC3774093.1 hypothetical protein [Streptomyces sp. UNOB3_S3]
MEKGEVYEEELEYLLDYARSLLHFIPLRDSAEIAAGDDATEEQVQGVTLELIGDLIDRGVIVGDQTSGAREGFVPWNLSKEEALRRVAEEMKSREEDPTDFVYICWFDLPEQQRKS